MYSDSSYNHTLRRFLSLRTINFIPCINHIMFAMIDDKIIKLHHKLQKQQEVK